MRPKGRRVEYGHAFFGSQTLQWFHAVAGAKPTKRDLEINMSTEPGQQLLGMARYGRVNVVEMRFLLLVSIT